MGCRIWDLQTNQISPFVLNPIRPAPLANLNMRGTCFVARLFSPLALLAVSVISESTLDLPAVPTAVSYPFSDSNGTASSVPSSKGDLEAEPPIFHRVPGQGPWVQKFANETVFNATVLRNTSYSSENPIRMRKCGFGPRLDYPVGLPLPFKILATRTD